jgi:hypothetical protein
VSAERGKKEKTKRKKENKQGIYRKEEGETSNKQRWKGGTAFTPLSIPLSPCGGGVQLKETHRTIPVVFLGQFGMFAGFAASFYAGSRFVDREYCSFAAMFESLSFVSALFCKRITTISKERRREIK